MNPINELHATPTVAELQIQIGRNNRRIHELERENRELSDRAELWEFRARENGKSTKHFKNLYQQSTGQGQATTSQPTTAEKSPTMNRYRRLDVYDAAAILREYQDHPDDLIEVLEEITPQDHLQLEIALFKLFDHSQNLPKEMQPVEAPSLADWCTTFINERR